MRDGYERTLTYRGSPMAWGDKREASGDLTLIARTLGAPTWPGGGGVNFAAESGPRAMFLDTNGPSETVRAHLAAHGVRTTSLGRTAPPVNIILTERQRDERAILKSPLSPRVRLTVDARVLSELRGKTLVANSTKNAALLLTLALHSERLFAALTGVPVAERLQIAARSQLAVCNLAEFAETAAAVGVASPEDERTARLDAIASAMLQFRDRLPVGDLVVTVGRGGALMVSRKSPTSVLHVSARPSLAQRERLLALRRNPARLNGAGDRFFAALVGAFVDAGDLLAALQAATAAVVNTLVHGLGLTAVQTNVRVFAA